MMAKKRSNYSGISTLLTRDFDRYYQRILSGEISFVELLEAYSKNPRTARRKFQEVHMKVKKVAVFLSMFFILASFSSIALADAPTAMSFFSDPEYNKTYTGDDGLKHTMTVTKVGETWNKIGSVIYDIYYNDCYTVPSGDRAGDHTDATATTVFFDNARPTYPDSTEYSVYRCNWYKDGHYTVSFDYRPAATPAPTAKPEPTPAPMTNPTEQPTAKPTAKPTVKATAKPTDTPTATPTAMPTSTPTASPTPTALSTETPTHTPTETPTPTASPVPAISVAPTDTPAATVAPTLPVTAEPGQSEWKLYPTWAKVLLIAAGVVIVGVLFVLIFSKEKSGKKKGRNNEKK